ncbi:MAG: hypothetical protein N3A38_16120, partial [Planctomycetota bacterium]|nr:hypothetical protein [Planctomycetota bacterium]
RRGLEGAMMFGTGTDAGPRRPEPGQTIAAACPGLPWTGRGHPNFSGFPGGARVGYTCYVWGSRPIPDPSAKRLYGWNRKPGERIVAAFPRAGSGTVGALRENAPLAAFMSASEGYHAAGEAGFGSMGADFWDVLSRDSKEINPYSRAFNVIGRYVESHYGQVYLGNSCAAVLAPGPDGAVPTVRFMAIRLGAQIAEARVFVERALLDPARKAGMSAELAERARKLLDERTRAIIRGVSSNWVEFDGFDWQDRDDRLYELCAGIARSNP